MAELQACLFTSLPGFRVMSLPYLVVKGSAWHETPDLGSTTSLITVEQLLGADTCRNWEGSACDCSLNPKAIPGSMSMVRHNQRMLAWEAKYHATLKSLHNGETSSDPCSVRQVTELDVRRHPNPVLLLSTPGAGNTFVRLLIERATGFYTGAVYDDVQLRHNFPGEGHMTHTIAIKRHPIPFASDRNPHPDYVNATLMVFRSPYNAALAEFTRGSAGHIKGTSTNPHSKYYTKEQFKGIKEGFLAKYAVKFAKRSTRAWNEIYKTEVAKPAEYQLVVHYEDLVDKAKRAATLTKMVKFLLGDDAEVTETRLKCAFDDADNPATHRAGADKVTAADVYTRKEDICRIWSYVKGWAAPLGYTPFNDVDCSDYSVE
eukprot:m.88909 g.88909  ORF g.88909 m.88909 type:complete len:374 (+) comp14842_c0_seq2:117-1238(+)